MIYVTTKKYVCHTLEQVQSKYDPDLSKQILAWINDIVEGVNIDTDGSEDNFHAVLKNGVVLCK